MTWSKRSTLTFCLGAGLAASLPTQALADKAAEEWLAGILAGADDVFNAADESARLAAVEELVAQFVDMNKVARFVLGQYARVISKEQWALFRPLFKRYATLVYQKTLKDYSGERLAVKNSIDRTPRDIIVNTGIANAAPGQRFATVTVHWRLYRDKNGAFSVVDAGAEGVWLAIEQQSQFKAVIANNGGGSRGIDALIADLQAKVGGA